mmetsp:Transcript_22242/g.36819  ORF Transcript_22242/g.36819 Transcript_22242/m.36819 type:complete len:204 (-) Transcript_22242:394-1005(-)|eukprot:CAMPEP_0119310336 /NCGR_PEP_ID=MMETSP1333-20130426/18887_1 /TAXON_ID=418940 /ORGANISM="Scyphosphaera apsteinii, Strain RCC1455" /LENGTH=203 /DNA_ID=CAMNT_0007314505 /DNA_START=35 /DNA_END=646 /DNA_ORIENTATION=+
MGRVKKQVELIDPDENWKSKDPKELAYEIATFMGGEWPTRPIRKVQLSLDGAPTDDEELFEITKLNPTLLSEMTIKTRFLFLEVYLDDIQDVYSEVMETLQPPNLVSYNPLRKFKHLTISLSYMAVSQVCQDAFDAVSFDDYPEVAPDDRPGLMCPLDIAEFTRHTAAATALTKMMVEAEGELPPAAEPRIIRVEKKFYYDDV